MVAFTRSNKEGIECSDYHPKMRRAVGLLSSRRCLSHNNNNNNNVSKVLLSLDEMRQAVKAKGVRMENSLTENKTALLEALLNPHETVHEGDGAYKVVGGLQRGRLGMGAVLECEGERDARSSEHFMAVTDQHLNVGPVKGVATVKGKAGRVTAVASVEWWSSRPSGSDCPVTVFIREPAEAWAMLPGTYRRREAAGDTEISMSALVQDVVRAALEPGFQHPVHVQSTLMLAGTHSSICAHLLATVTALRHVGCPLRPVGAVRVAQMADGSFCVDPPPAQSQSAVCNVMMVTMGDTGEIIHVDVEAKFLARSQVMAVVAHAHALALEVGQVVHEASPDLEKRVVFADETLVQPVVFPPDWVSMEPSHDLLESVRRLAGPALHTLASSHTFSGLDAVQTVLRSLEEHCMQVVRVRFTWAELRHALRTVLIEQVRAAARPHGLPAPKLALVEGKGKSKYVEVTHGGVASAAIYLDIGGAPDVRPDRTVMPSLWGQPVWTCHVSERYKTPPILWDVNENHRQRIAVNSEEVFMFGLPFFSLETTREARLSVHMLQSGASWDLGMSALCREMLGKDVCSPSVSWWGSGSMTARPDPLQAACAPVLARVAAASSGGNDLLAARVSTLSAIRIPSVNAAASSSSSSLTLGALEEILSFGMQRAAEEISTVLQPFVGEKLTEQPPLTMIAPRGLVHRVARSPGEYGEHLATLLGAKKVTAQGLDALIVSGSREELSQDRFSTLVAAERVWELGKEYDCVVRATQPYGAFVEAIPSSPGLSGLVHASKGGLNLVQSQQIRVRVDAWLPLGPQLVRL